MSYLKLTQIQDHYNVSNFPRHSVHAQPREMHHNCIPINVPRCKARKKYGEVCWFCFGGTNLRTNQREYAFCRDIRVNNTVFDFRSGVRFRFNLVAVGKIVEILHGL